MAVKYCDVGFDQIGKPQTLPLTGSGGTVGRNVRVAFRDVDSQDKVIQLLLTIEEALESRLRAENLCVANG